MNRNDSLVMDDTTYQLLFCESNNIFKPEYFGMAPIWSDDVEFSYSSIYELKVYQLYLKSLVISSDRGYPIINGVKPEPYFTENGSETVQYINIMELLKYTGGIIIANQFTKNYGTNDEISCYCYKLVKELIFDEGKLVTTIDHSKAMLRIRKNLELGLRRLDKKQDAKCIGQFIKASFAGDYEHPNKSINKSQKKKLNENIIVKKIKKYYQDKF